MTLVVSIFTVERLSQASARATLVRASGSSEAEVTDTGSGSGTSGCRGYGGGPAFRDRGFVDREDGEEDDDEGRSPRPSRVGEKALSRLPDPPLRNDKTRGENKRAPSSTRRTVRLASLAILSDSSPRNPRVITRNR